MKKMKDYLTKNRVGFGKKFVPDTDGVKNHRIRICNTGCIHAGSITGRGEYIECSFRHLASPSDCGFEPF
jgi:hypothetical protein